MSSPTMGREFGYGRKRARWTGGGAALRRAIAQTVVALLVASPLAAQTVPSTSTPSTGTTTSTSGGPFDHPLSSSATPAPTTAPPSLLQAPSGQSGAATASSSPTAPPVDPETSYRIAVTLFKGIDLSEENLYLRESLPLLILNALAGIETHTYTPTERAAYQRLLLANSLEAARASLSDLELKRSALFYSSSRLPASVGSTAAAATSTQPATGTASSSTAGSTTTAASTTTPTTTPTTSPSTTPTTTPTTMTAGAAPAAPSTTAAPAPSSPTSPFASVDASIAAAKQRIGFLESFDPAKIAVAATKPIVFATTESAGAPSPGGAAPPSGTASSAGSSDPPSGAAAAGASASPSGSGAAASSANQLLPYPLVSAASTIRQSSLDYLITGKITEVEGYLIIEVEGYDAAFGKATYTYRTVVSPSEAFGSLHEVEGALVTQVLGRPWANLAITVDPQGSLVFLDGSFYGIGNADLRFLPTGTHTILVRDPGYRQQELTVELAPRETKRLEVRLAPREASQVAIVTYPQGADVYLNSLWMGKSPLLVDRPLGPTSLAVQLDHYHGYSGSLTPESPAKTTIRLLPDTFRQSDVAERWRNQFYASFGAFALSVILPVTAYNLEQSTYLRYAQSQSTGGTTESQQLLNTSVAWYYAYLGGLFISISLFVNTVIDVVQYLRASD